MADTGFRTERDSMAAVTVPQRCILRRADTACHRTNTMMPIMSLRLLGSIQFSANAAKVLRDKCVAGMDADRARCEEMAERSLAMATALAPVIGYDRAAEIVQEALACAQTIRQVAQRKGLPDQERLDALLDTRRMTQP